MEALSLILFAGFIYFSLVVVPSIVEKVTDPEFKKSYFAYLSKNTIHSFGK